jgi:hypothetical protein
MPVAGIFALNMLGLYPVPSFSHRLLLFAIPITVLVFCLGLQFLVDLAVRLLISRVKTFKVTVLETALGSLMFVGLAGILLIHFYFVGLDPYFAQEHEDAEAGVKYLAQRVPANDVLYVHASMQEQFKLYSRAMPVSGASIVYGRVGMPCCPRNGYRSPKRESVEDIASEIFALSNMAAGRSLWLFITDRDHHWFHLQRDDIDMFERGLGSQGCEKIDEAKFTGAYIARFRCKP